MQTRLDYGKAAPGSVQAMYKLEKYVEQSGLERPLLELVKTWMGRIPFDLDILILDEIGKNISGAGMDTKVANRGVNGEYNPWPGPKFQRIFVRNLSEKTYNSAVGLGMADVVTDRLVNRIDWQPTMINSLTANTPAAIRTPIHFKTDRECIERIAPTVGKFDLGAHQRVRLYHRNNQANA